MLSWLCLYVTRTLSLSRDISETILSSLPSRGLEAIEKLKAKNTWTLKALPPFRAFLHLQSAELTFPSHCCGLKLLKRWRRWVQQSTAFPTVASFLCIMCTRPSHTKALRPALCAGGLTKDEWNYTLWVCHYALLLVVMTVLVNCLSPKPLDEACTWDCSSQYVRPTAHSLSELHF